MASDDETDLSRVRDGCRWRVGRDAEVSWIEENTQSGLAITSAIPPGFDAYATVLLPCGDEVQVPDATERYEQAVLSVLIRHTTPQSWWLGYLDTGADEIIFPDAPRVTLYADWSYVLIEAGPSQATTWRRQHRSFKGVLPDLMFPADRSWVLSTLWDDDWTCIGGSTSLISSLISHTDLAQRARQVQVSDNDATPPGHIAH
jgi:hypothetical protein